jgi:serine/arginine repetitive matrix protein 1
MRLRREKLTNERSLSPPKKQRTDKPRHGSPVTSEEAEETYYSRFEYDLDKVLLLG